jgi:hypothetical protein
MQYTTSQTTFFSGLPGDTCVCHTLSILHHISLMDHDILTTLHEIATSKSVNRYLESEVNSAPFNHHTHDVLACLPTDNLTRLYLVMNVCRVVTARCHTYHVGCH